MITLHPVKRAHGRRSNRFCGPSAISALTGLDTRDTAAILRDVSGRRVIKGTYDHQMRKACAKLGLNMVPYREYLLPSHPNPLFNAPTLISWLRQTRDDRGTNTYLLSAGHHWCIVQGRRYVCGITGRIVPFKDIPHRCARVRVAYQIVRTGSQRFASAVPARRPADPERKLREEAKLLAQLWGVRIETERLSELSTYWVWPPADLFIDQYGDPKEDPLDGERSCYSWQEVLGKVQVYVEAIKALRPAQPPAAILLAGFPEVNTRVDSAAQAAILGS